MLSENKIGLAATSIPLHWYHIVLMPFAVCVLSNLLAVVFPTICLRKFKLKNNFFDLFYSIDQKTQSFFFDPHKLSISHAMWRMCTQFIHSCESNTYPWRQNEWTQIPCCSHQKRTRIHQHIFWNKLSQFCFCGCWKAKITELPV